MKKILFLLLIICVSFQNFAQSIYPLLPSSGGGGTGSTQTITTTQTLSGWGVHYNIGVLAANITGSADFLNFQKSGVQAMRLYNSGLFEISRVSTNQKIFRINGSSGIEMSEYLTLYPSAGMAGTPSYITADAIYPSVNTSQYEIRSGTDAKTLVRICGSSHATKPNKIEFQNNNVVTASIDASGQLAISNTVTAAIAVASTHKVTFIIDGAIYYLLAIT